MQTEKYLFSCQTFVAPGRRLVELRTTVSPMRTRQHRFDTFLALTPTFA